MEIEMRSFYNWIPSFSISELFKDDGDEDTKLNVCVFFSIILFYIYLKTFNNFVYYFMNNIVIVVVSWRHLLGVLTFFWKPKLAIFSRMTKLGGGKG